LQNIEKNGIIVGDIK